MSILAALALLLVPSQATAPPQQRNPTAVPVLEKVLVIGASLSSGFGLEQDAGSKVGFADVIEASLLPPHERVRARTSLLFFVDPFATGKSQATAGAADAPTLVVAIDYLFWFGYGIFATDDDRIAMLDRGLVLLEGFTCPLVVGDIPDVGDAARSPAQADRPARAGLLVPEQVPTAALRARLNGRIRTWAARRSNVVVVPLGDLVARLHSGADLTIHENRWTGAALAGLVQKDRLHPTLEGAIALWVGALEAIVAGRRDVPASAFDWDVRSITKRLRDAVEKEREASEAKERARREAKGADGSATPRTPARTGGGR